MAFEYIKDHYEVPYFLDLGIKIKYKDKDGSIVKDAGNYIGINLNEDKPNVVCNVHPLDENLIYFDIKVPKRKLSKGQERYQRYLEVAECFKDFKHFLKWETFLKRKENYDT